MNHDDKIHWYYNGTQKTHGTDLGKRVVVISRATWRLDGFVSLDAGPERGVVETVPLRIPASQLEINTDAASGSIRVAVLTADRQVQAGLSAVECQPMAGDSVRHSVRWAGKVLTQAQQLSRLQFLMENVNLYALRLKLLSGRRVRGIRT